MPDKRMHDLRINGERACEASARGLSQCQRRAHDRWRPRVHGLTDGTFAAFDDNTLDQVWKINVGTGFNAPPITFEGGGASSMLRSCPAWATSPSAATIWRRNCASSATRPCCLCSGCRGCSACSKLSCSAKAEYPEQATAGLRRLRRRRLPCRWAGGTGETDRRGIADPVMLSALRMIAEGGVPDTGSGGVAPSRSDGRSASCPTSCWPTGCCRSATWPCAGGWRRPRSSALVEKATLSQIEVACPVRADCDSIGEPGRSGPM